MVPAPTLAPAAATTTAAAAGNSAVPKVKSDEHPIGILREIEQFLNDKNYSTDTIRATVAREVLDVLWKHLKNQLSVEVNSTMTDLQKIADAILNNLAYKGYKDKDEEQLIDKLKLTELEKIINQIKILKASVKQLEQKLKQDDSLHRSLQSTPTAPAEQRQILQNIIKTMQNQIEIKEQEKMKLQEQAKLSAHEELSKRNWTPEVKKPKVETEQKIIENLKGLIQQYNNLSQTFDTLGFKDKQNAGEKMENLKEKIWELRKKLRILQEKKTTATSASKSLYNPYFVHFNDRLSYVPNC